MAADGERALPPLAALLRGACGEPCRGFGIQLAAAAGADKHPRPSFIPGVPNYVIAVAVSLVMSALTVAGFVLQKKANLAHKGCRCGDISLSWKWVAGFGLGIIIPILGQILSNGLAPMSLTAPLSGVSVAMNIVLAPLLLGERVQTWPDLPASITILIGTALTTTAGSHEEVKLSFEELARLATQVGSLSVLIMLLGAIAGCIGYMCKHQPELEHSALERPYNPNILEVSLPAVAAACCGCLTNISLKGASELIFARANFFECLVMLLCSLVPSLAQLNYVNRGLRLYLQTIFFPVYSAMLVLANTLGGLVFFQEYQELLGSPTERICRFLVGVLMIVLGVVLFTFRTPENTGLSLGRARRPSFSRPALDNELLPDESPPHAGRVGPPSPGVAGEITLSEARGWQERAAD